MVHIWATYGQHVAQMLSTCEPYGQCGPNENIPYMDHMWTIHGPYMDHTWAMHGQYMDHLWTMWAIWIKHGTHMDHTWAIYRQYIEHIWQMYGPCMGHM